jgi:hypothetical protein
MMKKIMYCILALVIISNSTEHSLFIPRNFIKAYEDKTRSYDGKPGSEYWQNYSQYTIRVDVLPEQQLLRGVEKIVYTNNSPDTLDRIILRLYQDFYSKGGARDWRIDPRAVHDGVDLYDFMIRGIEIDLDDPNGPVKKYGTVMQINLDEPLNPESSLDITCKWRLTLPVKSQVRMGAYSDSSIFVAYWYPQIAVYDDIYGWENGNYGGQHEFHNDFADFDVKITVPTNFIVWATGVLQNPSENIREPFLSRYKIAINSDSVVQIIGASEIGLDSVTVQNDKNEWYYKAGYVSDFAFAVCRNHRWDAVGADVNHPDDRRVMIQAVYPRNSVDFHDVAMYSKQIIEYLSSTMPAIMYPYPSMTAFNRARGGGGMEFPMMVNDGSHTSKARTVGLTSHEIAHSYFPFYMGINERRYAWMDEGWANALTDDLVKHIIPDSDPLKRTITSYLRLAGRENDLPMMIPSNFLSGAAYRNAAYNRSAVAYQLLRDYLGDDLFKTVMQTYVERWNGKHPIPYDFFFTVNEVVQDDLAWFWDPWFFQRGHPDLGIEEVSADAVTIEKIGLLPVPVQVTLRFDDESEEVISKPMSIWKEGDRQFTFPLSSDKKLLQISLGSPHIPDVDTTNNEYTVP